MLLRLGGRDLEYWLDKQIVHLSSKNTNHACHFLTSGNDPKQSLVFPRSHVRSGSSSASLCRYLNIESLWNCLNSFRLLPKTPSVPWSSCIRCRKGGYVMILCLSVSREAKPNIWLNKLLEFICLLYVSPSSFFCFQSGPPPSHRDRRTSGDQTRDQGVWAGA